MGKTNTTIPYQVWNFNHWIGIEKYDSDSDYIVWNDFVGYRFHTFYDAWTAATKLVLGQRIR